MGQVDGKIALVTGGASGIGQACVETLAREGATVVISDIDAVRGQTLAGELERAGRSVVFIAHDVTEEPSWQQVVGEIERRYSRLDVLVANAGIAKFAPIASMPEAMFDELSETLFKGTFFTVQRALPYMRDGAAIILTGAADADKLGRAGTSIYNASKAAVRALGRLLSAELLPRRIRVNVLSPGMTDTPIITREGGPPDMTPEQLAERITAAIPMRRRGTAEEMAQGMLYLASDESRYCVGCELILDGGLSQLVNA